MMNFMHFVQGRKHMEEAVSPIEEKVFDEVDYEYLRK